MPCRATCSIALGRATAALPVFIVLAYRPDREVGGGLGVERIPDFEEMTLDEMTPDDAAILIRSKLGQVLGTPVAEDDAPDLVRMVTERSGGNPFYIEELISFVGGKSVDIHDEAAIAALDLPDSLHSLVLSRIDATVEAPRRTLKVASVVGRVFEAPLITGAYPELGELRDVLGHLDVLRTADLVSLDRELEQAYLFKHVAIQEVAYDSLPFSVRTMLHGSIGRYIEGAGADGADRDLDLLAHHFWLSDDDERKRTYLGRAADAARASYANVAAIDYLERLTPLLDGRERVEQTLVLAQVLHVTGDIRKAESLVRAARSLGGRARRRPSDRAVRPLAGRVGPPGRAVHRCGIAPGSARRRASLAIGDEAGAADVLQVTGTVAAQRGDPTVARERYLESLAIRERLGDEAGMAALTSNLGIVAQQVGEPAVAREYADRALALYTTLGDRRRIGTCHVNLAWMDGMAGDHEGARRHCEEAIRLAVEVGDRLNAGIAQNNLGDALRDLDRLDEAGEAYAVAVETYRDLNDLGPLMALLEDVAILAMRRDDHAEALTLVGASDALRSELGAPRSGDGGGGTAGPARAVAGEPWRTQGRDRASTRVTARGRSGDRPGHRGRARRERSEPGLTAVGRCPAAPLDRLRFALCRTRHGTGRSARLRASDGPSTVHRLACRACIRRIGGEGSIA